MSYIVLRLFENTEVRICYLMLAIIHFSNSNPWSPTFSPFNICSHRSTVFVDIDAGGVGRSKEIPRRDDLQPRRRFIPFGGKNYN